MSLLVDVTDLFKFMQLVKRYNDDLIPKRWDVVSDILSKEKFVRNGPFIELKSFSTAQQFFHSSNSGKTCQWLYNNLPNELVEAISMWDVSQFFNEAKCQMV